MAKFLTGAGLNHAVMLLFAQATEQLILISPYIKLDAKLRNVLQPSISNPNLEIIIVFGKNEDDKHKSLSMEDISFFVQFPNIQIKYENRLHAKYYANEDTAILTSLNLHAYSIDNNIEAGVQTSNSLKKMAFNLITGSEEFDDRATFYFKQVIEDAELIYANKPIFESKMMGFQKTYVDSYVEVDKLDTFFSGVKRSNFRRAVSPKPAPKLVNGYCIRTGIAIPFNAKRPFCDNAFDSWSKFKNGDYVEKYCHYTGEASNSETSFNKPVMRKNWAKAKEQHNF